MNENPYRAPEPQFDRASERSAFSESRDGRPDETERAMTWSGIAWGLVKCAGIAILIGIVILAKILRLFEHFF